MKIEISKDWCARMAQIESDAEIGAGLLAVDPVFDGEKTHIVSVEEPNFAFGRLVRLMRRSRRLSLEKLAEDADVDIEELVEIEDDTHYRPDARTVHQLANVFQLPRGSLLQVAGLTVRKNDTIYQEAIRFAARSEPVAELTPEERAALEAFVVVLSEQK